FSGANPGQAISCRLLTNVNFYFPGVDLCQQAVPQTPSTFTVQNNRVYETDNEGIGFGAVYTRRGNCLRRTNGICDRRQDAVAGTIRRDRVRAFFQQRGKPGGTRFYRGGETEPVELPGCRC